MRGLSKALVVIILSVLAKDLGIEGDFICNPRFFAEYRSE